MSLIIEVRTSDLKYLGNPQKTNKDIIFAAMKSSQRNGIGHHDTLSDDHLGCPTRC